MRLMFVYRVRKDVGSAQDIYAYTRVARKLGHEITLLGPPSATSPFTYSMDIGSADAVVFVLEWCYRLHRGGHLNLVRLLSQVPRERRVVVDNDGMYNDPVGSDGDYNYTDPDAARLRTELCDSLSDKIVQPTFHPRRANVRPFFFHAYNPAWEVPLAFDNKEFDLMYVGNNWFRWRPLERVLTAVASFREKVGRIGLVGYGWEEIAPWVQPESLRQDACFTDPDFLRRLGVEIMPAVHVGQVVAQMSRGVVNPVLVRPLFSHLRLATCRTFETLAASTIPLFAQDRQYLREIYGSAATELMLGENPRDQIRDVLSHPQRYASIVQGIRRHLAETHSYEVRLRQLIEIIES